MTLARQPVGNDSTQRLDFFVFYSIQRPQIQRQRIKRPYLFRLTILQQCDLDFHLFRSLAVAPQKAAIGQVGGVAVGQLSKAMLLHIALHHFLQLGLVLGTVAGRGCACSGQHAQGELHFQGVGISRQCRHIHGLQIGVFNGSVELGGVLILGFQAVADGAAHRLGLDGDRRPALGSSALFPVLDMVRIPYRLMVGNMRFKR